MKTILMMVAVGCAVALNAAAMTVDDAYAALKQRRTVFDAGATKASKAQVENLRRIFAIAEAGTILKVRAYQARSRGDKAEYTAVMRDYDSLVGASKRLAVTPEIKPAMELVAGAIEQQRAVFNASAGKPASMLSRPELERNGDARKIHGELVRAHDLLLKMFPNEPTVNRNAFHDYLSALDFL
jgi:hypothetical protein